MRGASRARAVLATVGSMLVTACAAFTDLDGFSGTPPLDAVASDASDADGASTTPDGGGGGVDAASLGRYAEAVLADGPVLYLRLGESASGSAVTAARDSSASRTDGVYAGAVPGAPGAIAGDPDTAATFAGSDSSKVRVATSNVDFSGRRPFSIEAWVNPPSGSTDSSGHMIVANDQVSAFIQSGILKLQRAGSTAYVWFNAGLPNAKWTHVVGTYDGNTMRLYLDGLDVGQSAPTNTLPVGTPVVEVGRNLLASLDEVAFYDRALAPERVTAHFQAAQGK